MYLHLFQRSVETAYYTVNSQCSYRPASIQFPQDLGLPQRGWCKFQCTGIWLRADRLESTSFSGRLTILLCHVSNATEQPMYLHWPYQHLQYTQQCYEGSLNWTLNSIGTLPLHPTRHSIQTILTTYMNPWKIFKIFSTISLNVTLSLYKNVAITEEISA